MIRKLIVILALSAAVLNINLPLPVGKLYSNGDSTVVCPINGEALKCPHHKTHERGSHNKLPSDSPELRCNCSSDYPTAQGFDLIPINHNDGPTLHPVLSYVWLKNPIYKDIEILPPKSPPKIA